MAKKAIGLWITCSALLLSLGLLPSRTHAETQPIWQIGTFDESSHEFKVDGINYADAAQDPVYTIGKSDPAKDWHAFQPGSGNGRAGFRPHPVTVKFDVPAPPKGVFTLKVGLLAYSPRLPRLQVEMNGHRGLFYQHPKLNYTGGDTASVFIPNYAYGIITAEIPAGFLNKGANTLVLTAVDEPTERDDSQPSLGIGNSFLTYDALELSNDPAARPAANQASAEVVPTIFYKSKNGQLLELVDVYVRGGGRRGMGRVTLQLGKEKFTQPLQSRREFGEERVEFEVPEFKGPAKGELTITSNRHSSRISVELTPGKKWNLLVVPNEHLDIGYSDYPTKVAEIQSRAIDEAIEMIRTNPDFRYSLDAYWCAEQFLLGRSAEQKQRFFDLVAQKKIIVPAQYASNATGFPSLEDTIRSLYPSYQFNLKHGGNFDFANITDVPSYSWSYASVMAAAGLKYFVAASDNWRAPVLLFSRLNEKSPFWWEGPDGGRILMWYSRHYIQVASLFGLPPQVGAGRDSLPIFLQAYDHPDYRSDGALIYGTQVENTDLFPQQAALATNWNRVYAYPKLQFTGFAEAMQYIASQFGDSIPVVRGDGGPYWEDGLATDAYITAVARSNEQRALAAEKFSTISSLVNPAVRPDSEALRLLWNNLLMFDEHTWTADRSWRDPEHAETIRQGEIKNSRATNGKLLLEQLLDRAMASIADYIQRPSGTLVVFNPLNWERSSLVEVDINKDVELLDIATQQAVPFEVLRTGEGYRHIRFLAEKVPAVGYKCYALQPARSEPAAPSESSTTTIENPYYRVSLDADSGAVRSILDKELNRELVDSTSPYRFNQYVYVTGADKPRNRALEYNPVLPLPDLQPHGATGGRLISVTKVPYGTVARLESSAVNTPRVETEVVLFDSQKKIEFINHVRKTKVYTKEAVYFAFPFAMDHPEFRYETQNGFVNPAKDMIKGAGLEWFSVQHWVAANQDNISVALVPVDGHLVTLGDIVRGTWPKEFGTRKGTIFSYLMSNYWETNWPAGQGGDFTFRYVMTSGATIDPGALSRLGWESMSPLEINEIKTQDKAITPPRPLDRAQSSFLQVNEPNVVLVTWKRAEDDRGTILRFVEVAGKSSTASISTPLLNIDSAWKCNAVEENKQALSVSTHGLEFPVKAFEIVTIRVQGSPALKLP
ncbi:MAG TPA: polysaccharide lyase family protein [Terriglobia bacterium]|nr:polysaccharide lyase family protein [Terriglobia bacterium]